VKAGRCGLEVTRWKDDRTRSVRDAKETTMGKCTGPIVLATAVAVLTLGCVRGLGSPTAPAADLIYMAKPMSAPADIISSETTVLWRDIGIYSVNGPLRIDWR
jgi:hypothetical protein